MILMHAKGLQFLGNLESLVSAFLVFIILENINHERKCVWFEFGRKHFIKLVSNLI